MKTPNQVRLDHTVKQGTPQAALNPTSDLFDKQARALSVLDESIKSLIAFSYLLAEQLAKEMELGETWVYCAGASGCTSIQQDLAKRLLEAQAALSQTNQAIRQTTGNAAQEVKP